MVDTRSGMNTTSPLVEEADINPSLLPSGDTIINQAITALRDIENIYAFDFINESDLEFTDISSEANRTYNFGNKGFVKINSPAYLNVSSSGGHRIYSRDGQSHYIPSGWIHLSWTAHKGKPNFVK